MSDSNCSAFLAVLDSLTNTEAINTKSVHDLGVLLRKEDSPVGWTFDPRSSRNVAHTRVAKLTASIASRDVSSLRALAFNVVYVLIGISLPLLVGYSTINAPGVAPFLSVALSLVLAGGGAVLLLILGRRNWESDTIALVKSAREYIATTAAGARGRSGVS